MGRGKDVIGNVNVNGCGEDKRRRISSLNRGKNQKKLFK
jgi:hypothetical protein